MVNYTFSLYDLEYFLLILVRIASFFAVAPFFGIQGVPARVKVGLAFCMTIIVYEITDRSYIEYEGMIGFSIIVVKEAICGLLIGMTANMCTYITGFAGHLVDMNIGLSMAQEYNPMTRTQESVTGNLYNYMVMLLLVMSDMYQYIVKAIADTFILIPVNSMVFNWESLATTMISFVTKVLTLGFTIMLPIFAVMLTLNCVLGIMAKVASQMNMFSVGMQIKLLGGYALLLVCVGMMPKMASLIAEEMKEVIRNIVLRGLIPS